jgi:hypothetical protein
MRKMTYFPNISIDRKNNLCYCFVSKSKDILVCKTLGCVKDSFVHRLSKTKIVFWKFS